MICGLTSSRELARAFSAGTTCYAYPVVPDAPYEVDGVHLIVARKGDDQRVDYAQKRVEENSSCA